MAVRPGLDPVEESKSFSALFVLMVALLLVGAVWAIWDDNVSRRPWKEYQVEFDRLAYDTYMKDAADEQARLNQDADYVKLTKELAAAQAELDSGATASHLEDLRAQLRTAKQVADDKDQPVRFTKSELTERWYDYNHAIQQNEDPAPFKKMIDDLDQRLQGEQTTSDQAKHQVEDLQSQIEALNSKVDDLHDKLAKYTKVRDDLFDKADGYMIPVKFMGRTLFRYPKIPKIQQTAIEDYDRNAFDEAVARVDRCQSCHFAEDKKGFENAPEPFRTHSNFHQIIDQHPSDKLGCTPCHEGQPAAVNSIAEAHGDVEHWDHPLLTGDKMQSRCIKCHIDVGSLRDAGGKQIAVNWVQGERLFEQMGCHGCHLVAGYEDMPKIGPYLKLASAKLDRSWSVRWITNPHEFRPHTRMPNFMFNRDQAIAIAAYLDQNSDQDSQDWLKAHPQPPTLEADIKSPAMVEEGKGLFESVGCKACHAIEPDQFGTPVGSDTSFKPDEARTTKDFAPNLSKIAEKTDARWVYYWIKNPRDFSPHTAMPSLRLSDHEATALTAFLMTHGEKKEDPNLPALTAMLNDPAQAAKGAALIRKYGCFGCHEINGMEHESRIGVELTTFGSKHLDELFFGNRTDIPETWDDWTYHKLYTPRVYATANVEQLMPNFDFQPQDINDLRVFLAGLTEGTVLERYRSPGSDRQNEIVDGRRMVNYYNCVGCHIIEGRGGYIRRFYADNPNFAPPILNGEGEKIQPQWLYGFLAGTDPDPAVVEGQDADLPFQQP